MTIFVIKSFKHKIFDFFKKRNCSLEGPEHDWTWRSKIGWKTSEILTKNGEKVGKIEFLRKIRPCSLGCKASFYRKTTWPAFIFHLKKSFNQHTSEIGGGRCNCLVSWRGMTQVYVLSLKFGNSSFLCLGLLLLCIFAKQSEHNAWKVKSRKPLKNNEDRKK